MIVQLPRLYLEDRRIRDFLVQDREGGSWGVGHEVRRLLGRSEVELGFGDFGKNLVKFLPR